MQQQRGVTLIEILVAAIWVGIIFICARYGYGRAHWPGLLGGIAIGIIAPPVIVHSLGFLEDFFWGGIPRFPQCRAGTCGKDDYETIEFDDHWLLWQCKCGKRYDKQGRRFVEVDDEGMIHHYLKWVPFKGWTDEE